MCTKLCHTTDADSDTNRVHNVHTVCLNYAYVIPLILVSLFSLFEALCFTSYTYSVGYTVPTGMRVTYNIHETPCHLWHALIVQWQTDCGELALSHPMTSYGVMRSTFSFMMSHPAMSLGNRLLLRPQKGRGKGRWVGAPKGCKQHGRVWAQL